MHKRTIKQKRNENWTGFINILKVDDIECDIFLVRTKSVVQASFMLMHTGLKFFKSNCLLKIQIENNV